MADTPKKLPGLILVQSHAQLVAEKKKTLFVKSEEFKKYVGQEVFVISGDEAWAIITFAAPKKITLKQFEAERVRHKISDQERKEWWGGKRILYAYKIFLVKSFVPPIKANYEKGPQVFIREVETEPIEKRSTESRIVREINETELPEDFGIKERQVREEVRHPMVKTLGDYIDEGLNAEKVLVESLEDTSELEPMEDQPIRPVRQAIPGSYAERIQKMRTAMGKSDHEVIQEPKQVKQVRKSVDDLDLLSRFKRKLQGHE